MVGSGAGEEDEELMFNEDSLSFTKSSRGGWCCCLYDTTMYLIYKHSTVYLK